MSRRSATNSSTEDVYWDHEAWNSVWPCGVGGTDTGVHALIMPDVCAAASLPSGPSPYTTVAAGRVSPRTWPPLSGPAAHL
jgi:hypothetical protein